VKLLRVLDDRVIERVAGIERISVDARILATTKVDLETKITAGEFRNDLYHRLNSVPIYIPPLRKREGDIPLLAEHFLKVYSEGCDKPFSGFTKEAMDMLCTYHWPGNVRHLENLIERAVIICPDEYISSEYIEPERRKGEGLSNPCGSTLGFRAGQVSE